MRQGLLALGGEGADPAVAGEIARELHTLKGESRMLAFERLSELADACEEALAGPDAVPAPASCAKVGAALAVVERALFVAIAASEGATPSAAEDRAAVEALAVLASDAVPAAAAAVSGPAAAENGAASGSGSAASPAAAPGVSGRERRPLASTRWVQVGLDRIDEICERVLELSGDLAGVRAAADRLVAAVSRESDDAARAIRRDAILDARRGLQEELDRGRARLVDVTGAAWALRLAPVEPTLAALVEHTGELAKGLGKPIQVVVDAAACELERAILDELWDPLLHLVRNAVDHGVEAPGQRGDKSVTARITLRAAPVGDSVLLTVEDDGAGVDLAAVREAAVARGLAGADLANRLTEDELLALLFSPGMTTRHTAGALSGRGIGLDIVRDRVESLGGSVTLESEPGLGTRCQIKVPGSISRERALVFECGRGLWALPSRQVLGIVRLGPDVVETTAGGLALRYLDDALPLWSMTRALTFAAPAEPELWAVVVESPGRSSAFAVPALLGEHELLRRPSDALVALNEHVAASAMLEGRGLVLLLLLSGLLRRAAAAARAPASSVPAAAPARRARRGRVLVVDDSVLTRDLVAQILSAAQLDVIPASNGREALTAIDAAAPDLVLADVDMPVMDGLDFLRAVRASRQDLPVIMLTSHGSAADRIRATELGANAYLVKSQFREEMLIETVRRFLGEAT